MHEVACKLVAVQLEPFSFLELTKMHERLRGCSVGLQDLAFMNTKPVQQLNIVDVAGEALQALADILAEPAQRIAELLLLQFPFLSGADHTDVAEDEVDISDGVACIRKCIVKLVSGVLKVNDGSKSNEIIDLFLHLVEIVGKSGEHLSGTLVEAGE